MAVDAKDLPPVDNESWQGYQTQVLTDHADAKIASLAAAPQPAPTPTPTPADPSVQDAAPVAAEAAAPTPAPEPEPVAPPNATTGQPKTATTPQIEAAAMPTWVPDKARVALGIPSSASGEPASLADIYNRNAGKTYLWGSAAGRTDFGNDPKGFDCLAGTTIVVTHRGMVPISEIVPGDRVLTREGYRSVFGAWCAGEREVWRVRIGEGRILLGTAQHMVWVIDKGWKALSTLAKGDMLLACQQRLPSCTASDITVIRNPRVHRYDATFSAQAIRCTERSGDLSTGRSLSVTKSITPITTRSITPRTIWRSFQCPGIVPNRPMLGLITHESVAVAEPASLHKGARGTQTNDGFVLAVANRPGAGRPDWIAARLSARNADAGSVRPLGEGRSSAGMPVLRDTVGVLDAPQRVGWETTYDLEVDGCHEFVANGVLVSNCSGFVAYALDKASGGAVKLPAYTDAIASSGAVVQTNSPQPGDVVLYKFNDPGQPGVKYPHTALYMGNGQVMQSGGNQNNVNTAPIDQLPGATFWRPKAADTLNLGDLTKLGGTAVSNVDASKLPDVDLKSWANDQKQSLTDYAKQKVQDFADSAAAAPQSFMDYVGQKIDAFTNNPGGALAKLALDQAPLSDQQKAEVLANPGVMVPNVTGFQPNVPIDQQNPENVPAGSLASQMIRPPDQAGPPSPAELRTASLLHPDLASGSGIHGFSSALGEAAGEAVHAALPEGVQQLPVLKGALEQVLNPELAPGSAVGELAGAAIGGALKVVPPVLRVAARATDTALLARGVDLGTLAPEVHGEALAWLAEQGIDAPTVARLSDAAMGRAVGNAIDTVKATAAASGATPGTVAANAGMGAGVSMAADQQQHPDAGLGERALVGLAGAGLGAGAAIRGATIGAGVRAVGGALPDMTLSTGQSLNDVVKAVNGGEAAKTPFSQQMQSVGQDLERLFADRYAPINRLGSPEAEAKVANYAGRSGSAMQRIEDGLGPVYKALDSNQGKNQPLLEDFNAYVEMQHYLDVAKEKGTVFGAQDAQGNAIYQRFAPGGIRTTQQAQEVLDAIASRQGPENMAKIQEADGLRQEAMNSMLQDKVKAGFITQGDANMLMEKYPHYNPVSVLQAIESSNGGAVAGNKLSQVGNTIKRLTEEGSEADRMPAMQSAALALSQGQSNIMRNDAVSAVVDAAKVPVKRAVEFRSGPDIATGDTATVITGKQGDKPGEISFWKGGKRYTADFSSMPDVERSLKAMDDKGLPMAAQVAQVLNSPLRAGATTLSIPFQLRNALFDAIDAYTRAGIKPWGENGIFKGYVSAWTKDAAYKRYIEGGGGMGGYFMREPNMGYSLLGRQLSTEKGAAMLEKQVRTSGGITIESPGDVLRMGKRFGIDAATLAPIRHIGETIELGPRLAAYKQALASGATGAQAVTAGRRITVDFSRMGDAMKVINAVIPFSNAALQGSLNIARSARDNPAKMAVRLGALTTAVASSYAWNRQFRARYQDVPEYVKANSLVIMLPGGEPNANGQPGYKSNPYVAIPLREMGVLPYMITKALERMDGQNPDFGRALVNGVGALNPISGEPGAAGLLGAPGREFIQQLANYDIFRGRPIVSERLKNYQPGEQSTPQTSPAVTDMANLFNHSPLANAPLIGGDKSPVRMQRAIEDLTGGFGKTVLQGIDTAAGKPSDLPPVVGGAVSGLYRNYGGETEQRMYDQRDQRMEQLGQQYRDTLAAMTKNGANVGPPPSTLEGVELKPPEQAEYRAQQLAFLDRIFKETPGIDQALGSIDTKTPAGLRARAMVLDEFKNAAGEYAKGIVMGQIAKDIPNRVANNLEADPRELYPAKDYTPVGGR